MEAHRFAPRGRRALAVYIAAGLILFVLFLIASFPYSATISTMLAPYHLRLTYQRQRISLPIGAELLNVSLEPAVAGQPNPLLKSPEVTLAPTLSALFLGSPGLRVTAYIYDGVAHFWIRRDRDSTTISFNLNAINPAHCAPLQALGAIVEGSISAAGRAHIVSPDLRDNSADLTLKGGNVVLTVVNGIGFPPVILGNVTGIASLAGGSMTIAHVHAEGGDADLDGAGTIWLGRTLADSTIEFHFTLAPTPAGRDHLGFFLNALPRHDDPSMPYTLSGPLLRARLS
jgi:type II secretion system protein N